LTGHILTLALTVWFAWTAAAEPLTNRQAADRLAVAVYDGPGSAGKGVPRVRALLGAVTNLTVARVSPKEIEDGALKRFDVVMFTGGSGSGQAKGLGTAGRESVKEFVERGGGYVGICAGSYLACSGFSWGLGLINAKTLSPLWKRGTATVKMEMTDRGREIFGPLPGELDCLYYQGPIVGPAGVEGLPEFEPLAYFRSEVAKNNTPKGIMVNSPAVFAGRFGKGRVLCFSPHPEQTKGLESLVTSAVTWAGASSSRQPEAGAQESAVTDDGFWKVGVARSNITPTNSLWMGGYAGRTRPADGKITDLWLKALAFEDAAGHRAVIVSSDLLAIRASLHRRCLPRLKDKFGLEPSQILLTASHTHSGPMLVNRPGGLSAFDEPERSRIEQYSAGLADAIVETTGRALADLAPARLAAGQAETGFAANRRNNAESKRGELAERGALAGPMEHSVPVLAAYGPDGRLRAVLFGYACHNTTLTSASDAFYKWCGDYAGYAQAALEKRHPQATALFFIGCAGDQDPVVRGRLELAQCYGDMLAAAVERVLSAPPILLPPALKTAMEMVTLNLGEVPTEAELKRLAGDQTPYVRRWATNLLADLKSGKPLERTWPYPVQAWQFGGRQLLITLGGEPVADYALKFKREFGPQTWVAGYGNDVMCYIPSLRVLNEDKPPLASPLWGYEGCQALKVLGLPALRWADDVEDLVTAGVRRVVSETGTQ